MRVLKLLGAAVVALGMVAPVAAQTYPSKPVKIIVPHPSGGSADALVRLLARHMADGLKTAVVVENKLGANGLIGLEAAARSAPDGYTLVMGGTSSLPMNSAIYPKMPVDPVRDFAPISTFSYSPLVLVVNPNVPAKNVAEFVALAKAKPGEISYASFGIGSTAHFAGELFGTTTDTKLLHIPYNGSGPSTVDLLAGRVMACFDTMQNATQYIKSNRLRALGLASLTRSPVLPDVPTISESGVKDFEIGSTFGLLAPAGTPRDIITRLHGELARVLALPEVAEQMRSTGTEPLIMSPEKYAEMIKSEMVKWQQVARAANIRAQ